MITIPVDLARFVDDLGVVSGGSDGLIVKHYAGRHDQSSHGNWAGGAISMGPGVAASILERFKAAGGLSVNMLDGSEPTSGFMVAKGGTKGAIVDSGEFFDQGGGATHLASFLKTYRTDLTKGSYLGLWNNTQDAKVYLDVADNIQDRQKAITAGKRRNQISIWDVANFEEINTGGTGELAKEITSRGTSRLVAGYGRRDRQVRATDLGKVRSDPIVLFPHVCLGRYSVLEIQKHRQGLHDQETHGNWAGNRYPTDSVKSARDGAKEYAFKKGLTPDDTIDYTKVVANRQRASRIADIYETLPEIDRDAVDEYEALASEVEEQFDYMTKTLGVKVEFVADDPYKTSKEMFDDVSSGSLKVLSTATTGAHPIFSNEQNDKFRAVHDYFGHAATGRGFGQDGEESAWVHHSQMFTEKATAALTTETRGQNSFFNNRGKQFADQKVALLPEEFWEVPEVFQKAYSEVIRFAPGLVPVLKHATHDQSTHGNWAHGEGSLLSDSFMPGNTFFLEALGRREENPERGTSTWLAKRTVSKNIADRMKTETEVLAKISNEYTDYSEMLGASKGDGVIARDNNGHLSLLVGPSPFLDDFGNPTYSWRSYALGEYADKDIFDTGTPEARQVIREAAVSDLVRVWAETSNNTATALAIQHAAAMEFNLSGYTKPKDIFDPYRTDINRIMSESLQRYGTREARAVLRDFVSAQYAETQQLFAENGISEVEIYRGMTMANPPTSGTSVNMRPLSSWSLSADVAESFALDTVRGRQEAVTMKATVPVSRILSTPITGVGCLAEGEVVILGGTMDVKIQNDEGVYKASAINIDTMENADWIKTLSWDMPTTVEGMAAAFGPDWRATAVDQVSWLAAPESLKVFEASPAVVIKFAPGLKPILKHAVHDQSTHGNWADGTGSHVTERGGVANTGNGYRMADLPEAARVRVDNWCESNGVDVQAMADEMYNAFNYPDAIAKGSVWYEKEFQQNARAMADRQGISVEESTAAIAITSARTRWMAADGSLMNVNTAERFYEDNKAGKYDGMNAVEAAMANPNGYLMGKGFGENLIGMIKGEITVDEAVTGAKRRSFFNNGMFPDHDTSVTMDVWMGQFMARHSGLTIDKVQSGLASKPPAYLIKAGHSMSPAYFVLSEATMRAHDRAISEGIVPETWLPHQTQATMWIAMSKGYFGAVEGVDE